MRAHAALCLMLALTACGFEPMYASHTNAPSARVGAVAAHIAVEALADGPHRRLAQQFKMELEDGLNPNGGAAKAPLYHLEAVITVQEVPVGVSQDGTVSRYNVVLSAQLRLLRISDGVLVYQGKARATSSYNNLTNAFYSTYISSQDAMKRATTGLAEDVQLRLAGLFSEHPVPAPVDPAVPPPPPAVLPFPQGPQGYIGGR